MGEAGATGGRWGALLRPGALVRGGAAAFVLRIVGAGLIYLAQVIIARWLGAEAFGHFSYGWTLGVLLAVPATLGLQTVFLRFHPTYAAQRAFGLARGLGRFVAATITGASLAAALLAGLLVVLMRPWMDPAYVAPLLLGAAAIPLFAALNVLRDASRAMEQPVLAFAPREVAFNGLLIVLVALLAVSGATPTATVALGAMLAALALVALVHGLLVRRRFAAAIGAPAPEYRRRAWLRVALPLLLVATFLELLARIDVLMIGMLLTPADVAVYNAAARTATLVEFIAIAVLAIAPARFAALHAETRTAELVRLVRRANHAILWPTLAVSAVLVALAEPVLALFGAGFTGGATTLVLLAVSKIFVAHRLLTGSLLSLISEEDRTALVFGAAVIVTVVLNLALIPLAGIEGAAAAALVTAAASALALEVIARRRLGFGTFGGAPRR